MSEETKEVDIVKIENDVQPSIFWMKNSAGKSSVTLTFMTIAFIVTTIAYILSIVEKIGPVSIRGFDASACASYFSPICALYFSRRYTEAKFEEKK
jgi:hypothetical protein